MLVTLAVLLLIESLAHKDTSLEIFNFQSSTALKLKVWQHFWLQKEMGATTVEGLQEHC